MKKYTTGQVTITDGDRVDPQIRMVHSFVLKASMSIEKEEKAKNLLLAQETIRRTLDLMGFEPDL